MLSKKSFLKSAILGASVLFSGSALAQSNADPLANAINGLFYSNGGAAGATGAAANTTTVSSTTTNNAANAVNSALQGSPFGAPQQASFGAPGYGAPGFGTPGFGTPGITFGQPQIQFLGSVPAAAPIAPAPLPSYAAPAPLPTPVPVAAPVTGFSDPSFAPFTFSPSVQPAGASISPYFSLSAGLMMAGDTEQDGAYTIAGSQIGTTTPINPGSSLKWTTRTKVGQMAAGAIGFRLGHSVRLEIEGAIRNAEVDKHSDMSINGALIDGQAAAAPSVLLPVTAANVGAILADGRGDISIRSAMVNGLFDLKSLSNSASFTPYFGAGVGMANVRVDYQPSDAANDLIDDSASGVALQAMAGASFKIAPQMSLFGQYRFFTVRGVDLDAMALNATDTPEANVEFEHASHSIEAGVRFSF